MGYFKGILRHRGAAPEIELTLPHPLSMMGQMKNIFLSPSALSVFRDCPRCFWLEKVKGIRRPRGIFPSLPNGMDRVIKTYFDAHRKKGTLPPELGGTGLEGVELFRDQTRLDAWRNWRTGLQYRDTDGSILSGALDDLLVKEGRHLPFDYKTKGSPASEESSIRYYQHQLDCYALLLEENGLPTTGQGYLLYYSPQSAGENGQVAFLNQAIKVPTDIERARKLFRTAVSLIKGPMPAMLPSCEYCAWLEKRRLEQGELFSN